MGMEIKSEMHLGEFLFALDSQTEMALEAIGVQGEGHAQQELENSPKRIDTGLLRNSITHAVDGKPPAKPSYSGNTVHGDNEATRRNNTVGKPASGPHEGSYSGSAPSEGSTQRAVYIGTNVEYAIYVHDGTQRMPKANPFIKNAVTNYADEYRAIVERFMKE